MSPESRRETVVSLSPTGQRLVDRVTTVRRREIERIVQRISPDALGAAIEALSVFTEAAGEVPETSWSLGWS